jgi:hypothetical protein
MVFAIGIARFVALNRGYLLDQRRIPGLAQASRLRKLRRENDREISALPASGTAESESVQAFNMTCAYDTEAWHAGICTQGDDLLLDCHVSEQVGDALLGGEMGVFKPV